MHPLLQNLQTKYIKRKTAGRSWKTHFNSGDFKINFSKYKTSVQKSSLI